MDSEDQSNFPTKPVPVPKPPELNPEALLAMGLDRQPKAADGVSQGLPLTGTVLDAMLGVQRGEAAGGRWEPPTPEELQRDFPQYEIRGILGRGGMGAVYKAWQKSLDRFVAIKILPPVLDDGISGFTERFKREGKAMAQLQHPGIVAVFDAGSTPSGLLYFVMECITGTDLQQLVKERGRLDPAEALRITFAVCDALGYAHEHGLIHRDVKPSNIMLDERGAVKVADFGLAKSTAPETTQLTMSNTAMGTPDFMAPEARKGAANVDHRADLYAVGVMLYEMLTGEIPRGRFVPPSRAVPGLDKRLDAIVDKALQTEPAARYSSAIELRTAIQPVLAKIGTRPSARVSSATDAGSARGATHSTIAIAAVGVLCIVAWFAFGKRGQLQERGRASNAEQSSLALQRVEPSATNGHPDGLKPSTTSPTAVAPSLIPQVSPSPASATKDAPFVNTLGMKFVPVPITGGPTGGQRVLFSVWETRVQDYETFVKETKREWLNPAFEQGPTHPAVMVSWEAATAFCAWLTERERKAGTIASNVSYRLPSDHEWSCALGIGAQEDAALSPGKKSGSKGQFVWGTGLMPSPGAGNFMGEECAIMNTGFIAGYRDDYTNTAPVGSFTPNPLGLYDLAGNVGEWCADLVNPRAPNRVVRGGTCHDSDPDQLRSLKRSHYPPEARFAQRGFRAVLAPVSSVAPQK